MKLKKSSSVPLPALFVIDVDGVFTDGKFYYDSFGKVFKVFGPNDNDALLLIRDLISIEVVTADSKGFDISYCRIVRDMNLPLSLVASEDRVSWIRQKSALESTIYMGDGIFDYQVFSRVFYSIAPANAFHFTRQKASFVTKSKGSEGAVAEACVHIADRFFGINLLK